MSFGLFVWGPQNEAPAPDPRGVFEGAAEHLRGGARPRAGLSRGGSPDASFKPRGVPRGPRGRLDGLAGCRARLEEGVRARDASRRSGTRILYYFLRWAGRRLPVHRFRSCAAR